MFIIELHYFAIATAAATQNWFRTYLLVAPLLQLQQCERVHYRSGTVNSKSFVGKVLLRIKWKFELN